MLWLHQLTHITQRGHLCPDASTDAKEAHLDYGRLVSVKPPSTLGDAEPVVYVVADEDPDAALKLVADKVVIGSDMKIVGRASRQLLDALGLKPCEVVRA